DRENTMRIALGFEVLVDKPSTKLPVDAAAINFLAQSLGIDANGIKVVNITLLHSDPPGMPDGMSTTLITLETSDGKTYFVERLDGGIAGFIGHHELLEVNNVAQIISGLDVERAVNILSEASPELAAKILLAQEPIYYIAGKQTTTIYPGPQPIPTLPIISASQSAQILSAMAPEQAAAIVTCFFRQGEKLEIPGDIVSIPEKPVLQRPNPVSPIVKNIILTLDRIDHKAMRLILRHLDRETRRLVMSILRQRLPIIKIDGPLPLHTAGV
ncbi:MAG: hypothetical protein AABY43_05920, partial [Candidatus Omnitrophota bacterium]